MLINIKKIIFKSIINNQKTYIFRCIKNQKCKGKFEYLKVIILFIKLQFYCIS